MMKMTKIFGLFFILFFASFAFANNVQDPYAEVINETITDYMKNNEIPGVAVELYVNGKPYSYYYGYANLDKKTPINKKTIFEVGSISKVMTGLLLAEEIDFSKMQLKDSVTKFIPELPESFDDVSLQDLATYTGGLPFNIPDNFNPSTDFDKLSLSYPYQKQMVYSNLSVGLLGSAIEKRTHKDIDTLFRKQILAPLGMQPIATDLPKKLQALYAQGYNQELKPVNATPINSGLFKAAGGVKASASDMQRFLHAAIGLKGTPEKIFYPMRLTQTAFVKLSDHSQGLGWRISSITKDNIGQLLERTALNWEPLPVVEIIDKPTFNGNTLIDKTGVTDGFSSYVAVIPNKKSGIVILTNRQETNGAIVEVAREILFKVTQIISDENGTAV